MNRSQRDAVTAGRSLPERVYPPSGSPACCAARISQVQLVQTAKTGPRFASGGIDAQLYLQGPDLPSWRGFNGKAVLPRPF